MNVIPSKSLFARGAGAYKQFSAAGKACQYNLNFCYEFVAVHSYRKIPAYERAGYGPHWDPLSLREARSGTNAVKYTAISTGGLQGIPMRTIPCPLLRCFIGSREQ